MKIGDEVWCGIDTLFDIQKVSIKRETPVFLYLTTQIQVKILEERKQCFLIQKRKFFCKKLNF